MSAMGIRLQKDVEHKLIRMGIDLRDLDVLVIGGDVVLTGRFVDRISGNPLSCTDLQRVKQSLFRIPGVDSVRCQMLEITSFV